MNTNPPAQDEIYRTVGEEVARKEYHPGPMARAVAEAQGNRDLVQSLYIRFRYQELGRQVEREAAEEQVRREQEQKRRQSEQERQAREKDFVTCPHCRFRGKQRLTHRGSVLLMLVLMGAFLLPGILYGLCNMGQRLVCRKCGRTIVKRI